MTVLIRPAQTVDAADLARIHIASWRASVIPLITPEQLTLKNLDLDHHIARWQRWLATEEGSTRHTFLAVNAAGEAIGYVSGGRLREPVEDYDGELYQIYLLPSHWRQGIGRRLVHRLVEQLIVDGYQSMVLWVFSKNPALQFYRETLGGIYVAEQVEANEQASVIEYVYGWKDLPVLLARTLNPPG